MCVAPGKSLKRYSRVRKVFKIFWNAQILLAFLPDRNDSRRNLSYKSVSCSGNSSNSKSSITLSSLNFLTKVPIINLIIYYFTIVYWDSKIIICINPLRKQPPSLIYFVQNIKNFVIVSISKRKYFLHVLTHFSPVSHFYTPWFSDVFRGYRNVTLG